MTTIQKQRMSWLAGLALAPFILRYRSSIPREGPPSAASTTPCTRQNHQRERVSASIPRWMS